MFDADPGFAQWVWRILAAFAIAAVFQWLQEPQERLDHIGHRLHDQWASPPPPAEEEDTGGQNEESRDDGEIESRPPTRYLRAGLLDRLEEEAMAKEMIYDDIEDDEAEAEYVFEKPTEKSDEITSPSPQLEIKVAEEDVSIPTDNSPPATPDQDEVEYPSNSPTPTVDQSPPVSRQVTGPPPIKARNGNHPGLAGFRRWYEVEASLYRIYTIGRTDGTPVHPPFIPKSERGRVSLNLKVTNNYRQSISMYWVDYKGNEVHKGNVKNGDTFYQTTWIGHPWVFREKESGNLLCHYIPYKVIPTTDEVPTVDEEEPEKGVHRFTIVSLGQRRVLDEGAICFIQDPAFPIIIETTQDAAAWSFQEMSRVNYLYIDTLTKYLTNIVSKPSEAKYRQIRIANPRFSQQIWLTPARGLLLAAGFVEEGAYAEIGTTENLSRERVQDVATVLFFAEKWKRIREQSSNHEQPEGADGFGRANFGRWG